MKRYGTLRVEMCSDWGVGSGAGIPGSVDRQVLRDEDRLPFIPAKTLTGMLRDAAEFVAEARQRAEEALSISPGDLEECPTPQGRWPRALVAAFGNQPTSHCGKKNTAASEALFSVRSARFSEALRYHLADSALRDALCFVQPGNAVDHATGRAKEDHLFFREVVRGGCVLEAEVFVRREPTKDEERLFIDATKALRHIGGKRRRGGGECKVSFLKGEDRAEKKEKFAPPSGEFTIELCVETLSPLLVPHRITGNVINGRDFIPGSVLLPHVTTCLREFCSEEEIRGAVMKGELRVSHALPALLERGDGGKSKVKGGKAPEARPSLPMPMSFFTEKGASGDSAVFCNRLFADPAAEHGAPQYKGARGGWFVPAAEEGAPGLFGDARDLKTMRTHNSVADELQRPDESVGGVFSYEPLRRGAIFFSKVRVCGTLAEKLREEIQRGSKGLEVLSGIAAIGTSRKDDYGLVRISPCVPERCSAREISLLPGDILVVYLESDILLRDEALAFSGHPDLIWHELSTRLGVELAWREQKGLLSFCGRSERVDSWHTGWGLPRPSLVGIQKGSAMAFVVKNPEDWSGSRAGEVEMDGIGDRRAEGYGRILLNPAFLLSGRMVAHKAATIGPQGATGGGAKLNISDGDASFIRIVEREAWKEKIRRTARSYAYGDGNEFSRSHLSNAQLGALRAGAGSIADGGEGPVAEDAALALRWLGYEVKKGQPQFPDGVDPWPKSRAEKWGSLRNTIKNLLVEADAIWQLLECSPQSALDRNKPGKESELLRRTTWGFAVRALLDAVCEHAFDVSGVSTGELKGGRGA